MALVPGNPVVGGTVLRRAAITSPNFDLANPTASPTPSWGILQSGLAYFFGLILTGGTLTGTDYIINTAGAFFYSGIPASGNLIASIAHASGTDSFGNSYVAGFGTYDNTFGNTGQLNAANLAMFAGVNHTVSLNQAGLTIFNVHGATIFSLDETRDAFFLYADTGSASQGALLSSLANTSGTDSFGNAVLSGDTKYSAIAGNHFAVSLTGGTATFYDAISAGGPWTSTGLFTNISSSPLEITATQLFVATSGNPVTTEQLEVGGNIAAKLVKAIVSSAEETWHSLAALYQAGFADGTPASFYRAEPQGVTGPVVRLKGTFVLTANEVGGTTVLTLPTGYRPAQAQAFASYNNLSGYAAGKNSISISTGGVVTLGVAGSNGNFVQLDGITFPTD